MKHLKEITHERPPRVAPADILGSRALVSLLSDVVALLSGVFQLIKGTPVEAGDDDDHDDDEH